MFICDIYARLSHEEKESESIENQIKAAKEFIKSAGNIVINDIKCDDGFSGTDFNRPAFNEMIEDMKNGNINCVIVKDLSRLGRDYINTGRYIEEIFPMYNVRFIAVNDGIDTADKNYNRNDIMIPFKNLINEFYVRDISVKTKSSLRVKMKRGEIISSFAPYGYVLDDKRFEEDRESAETVRWIFEMYLRGYSCES
ncbi:MAG: recombinase family protein, partial [Firmicutes bacterium]|nr:recombinase family protein [Bacillota bacterium]